MEQSAQTEKVDYSLTEKVDYTSSKDVDYSSTEKDVVQPSSKDVGMSLQHTNGLELKDDYSRPWTLNIIDKSVPLRIRLKRFFAIIMLVIAIGEASFLFISAAKIFKTKSAKDLDFTAFIILLFSNILWTLYGFLVLKDIPLMVSGILYTIGSLIVIAGILKYGETKAVSKSNV